MPSDSTLIQYQRVINTLEKRGVSNFEDTAAVMEIIKKTAKGEEATNNSIKNNLNALMWKVGSGSPAQDIYRKKMYEIADVIKAGTTYTTTEKSVPWDVLSGIYKKYEHDSQDRRILAVYTLAPPRRLHDYASMQVVARKPKKIEGNYLVFNKSGMTFYFGDYKTKDTHGVQSFKVPPALREELDEYIVAGTPLFTVASGRAYGDTEFSKHIGDLTAPHIAGNVRATPTTFRHSYISHFLAGNPTTAQRMRVAEMMGHTSGQQLQYDQREE
jgi:integrase